MRVRKEVIGRFWRKHGPLVKTVVMAAFWTALWGVILPQVMLLSEFWWPVWKLGAWRYVALTPLALGAAMTYFSVWQFAIEGAGTPAPFDPPKKLMARGFYRYVRNPIYVGLLLVVLSELVLVNAVSLQWLAIVAGLTAGVHGLVVFYEEPVLRKKFGVEYEEYLKTVRRGI